MDSIQFGTELTAAEATEIAGGEGLWPVARRIAEAIGETYDYLTDPKRMKSYVEFRAGGPV